jgi:cytochrome c553
MSRFGRAMAFGVVCFVLGAMAERLYEARRAAIAPPSAAAPEESGRVPEEERPINFAAIHLGQEPLWAYGFEAPAAPTDKAVPQTPPSRDLRPDQDPAEQTRPRRLGGSTAAYSLVDIRDGQNVIDWFPLDHPQMPSVIRHGPAQLGKTRRGCGSCHLPNGKGRPENAGVAGLPATYFLRQIDDFRHGRRRSADPRKPNTHTMIDLAKALTEDEMRAAAAYFGSMTWTPWIRVVETNRVPKTRIVGNLYLAADHTLTEPIAGRIIETPEDEQQAETLRNPRSGFVAYVPPGSIEQGKVLVTTGGMKIVGNTIVQGKTTACSTCHGLDLMGVADVPPIAGRSPSYIVRQIWDMQQGTRNGPSAQLMKLVVANLTPDDLVAIAAYVSSLAPPRTPAGLRARLAEDGPQAAR